MNFAYWGSAKTHEEALERLLTHHDLITVDTETIGLKGDKSSVSLDWDDEDNESIVKAKYDARTLIGVGVAISETEAYYFPTGNGAWKNVPVVDLTPLERVLEDESTCFIMHNCMFDLERIEEGLGINVTRYHDTAIACQVQGLWNSLDENVGHLLGISHTTIGEVMPKGKTMLDVPFEITAQKNLADTMDTFKLFNRMRMREWKGKQINWTDHVGREFDVPSNVQDCYFTDLRLIEVLRKMNRRGIALKPEVVERWHEKLTNELATIDGYFSDLGVSNPGSNKEIGEFLVKREHYLGLTPSKKQYKVSEDILEQMIDPVAHLILARRGRAKLLGTYVTPFLEQDRMYSHWRADLATGRLASSDTSFSTFPPNMRAMLKADRGLWSWFDINQAEMRIWANQAHDEVMIGAFYEGSSPHITTLEALFPGVPKNIPTGKLDKDGKPEYVSAPEYTLSKSFNFGLLADASVPVLAKTVGKPQQLVAEYKRKMYDLYPATAKHQNYMRKRKIDYFYPDYVTSDFGRRCHIPDGIQVTAHHQEECRLNFPFQSTVADCVKRIMLGLDAAGYDFPVQLHDELLVDGDVEFPDWMAMVHPKVKLPFEVKHGESWV